MKIVTIKQNTRLWHQWRGKGLGASDAPTIMGDSPWSTPFQLWGEKTGLLERPEPNAFALAAMRRGQDLEPAARQAYERITARKMAALAGEHDVHEFLRASLDGIDEVTLDHFVEIKAPGKEAHDKAKKGKIPAYYYAQVQHQYLVTGAKTADYFSYRPNDEKPEIVIPIPNDKEYQEKLLAALLAFWKLVDAKTPPPVGPKDMEVFEEAVEKSRLSLASAVKNLNLARKIAGIEAPKADADGFMKVS